jgi:hypothetical protein
MASRRRWRTATRAARCSPGRSGRDHPIAPKPDRLMIGTRDSAASRSRLTTRGRRG